jgi:hypothetical protein
MPVRADSRIVIEQARVYLEPLRGASPSSPRHEWWGPAGPAHSLAPPEGSPVRPMGRSPRSGASIDASRSRGVGHRDRLAGKQHDERAGRMAAVLAAGLEQGSSATRRLRCSGRDSLSAEMADCTRRGRKLWPGANQHCGQRRASSTRSASPIVTMKDDAEAGQRSPGAPSPVLADAAEPPESPRSGTRDRERSRSDLPPEARSRAIRTARFTSLFHLRSEWFRAVFVVATIYQTTHACGVVSSGVRAAGSGRYESYSLRPIW